MQEALEQWKQMAWARESGIGEQEFPAGALYIVGLPIGNAADITIRALWTLAIADCVVRRRRFCPATASRRTKSQCANLTK